MATIDDLGNSASMDASGYIYVLFNPTFRENQFKIGMTAKLPEQRARELSAATGVPVPFEVLYDARVADRMKAERLIHQKLAQYRLSGNREFFGIPLRVAIATLNDVAAEVGQVSIDLAAPASASAEGDTPSEIDIHCAQERSMRRDHEGSRERAQHVTFEDHLAYADAVRRPILLELRKHILSLDDCMEQGEAVTRAQRIVYRIPGGTIFIEIKVQRSAILLRLIETGVSLNNLETRRIPESHGWRDLKDEIRLTTSAATPATFAAIGAAYKIAVDRVR